MYLNIFLVLYIIISVTSNLRSREYMLGHRWVLEYQKIHKYICGIVLPSDFRLYLDDVSDSIQG